MFSDNGPTHTETNGRPLDVEIHAMSYAYKRGTLIDNVIYYKFKVFNKSPNNYTNMRIAMFDDVLLGWYRDNYVGFDSVWRMGITYNGTNCDGCNAGYPANSYGYDPPQAAVTMIVLPGDTETGLAPAGSFLSYNNDFSICNPAIDSEDNFYIRGKTCIGKPLGSLFTTGTTPCGGFDSTADIRYMFPDDPSDSNGWSECNCNNNPGDRKFVMSSSDFTFYAGTSQTVLLALIVADSAKGCPVTNFSAIREVADTAWANYNSLTLGVTAPAHPDGLKVFPNPATTQLFIENTRAIGAPPIKIYNMIGQLFRVPVTGPAQKSTADISALPSGIYVLVAGDENGQRMVKFVKQ